MSKPITTRGWRRLPLPDLETLILKVRREAAHRHLSPVEWRRVDCMREREAALRKEATP
jgi:hypothetical protein